MREILLRYRDPVEAFEALIAATGAGPRPRCVSATEYLLTTLVAFEVAYRELLGVDYLYIVRSAASDPLIELRGAAQARGLLPGFVWPSDEDLAWGLLLLLVCGFAYDFPLARRYCHAPEDVHKRQTRLAGWGSIYHARRLARVPALESLRDFAEHAFRERLVPVAAHVVREAGLLTRSRLADTVAWVAP